MTPPPVTSPALAPVSVQLVAPGLSKTTVFCPLPPVNEIFGAVVVPERGLVDGERRIAVPRRSLSPRARSDRRTPGRHRAALIDDLDPLDGNALVVDLLGGVDQFDDQGCGRPERRTVSCARFHSDSTSALSGRSRLERNGTRCAPATGPLRAAGAPVCGKPS